MDAIGEMKNVVEKQKTDSNSKLKEVVSPFSIK